VLRQPVTVHTSVVQSSLSSHAASLVIERAIPPMQTSVVQATVSCGGVSESLATVTEVPL
jgi:hypothetical protein